jgi:hypothetical protein
MRSRKEDAMCFICDFWWLILLILSLITAAILLRNIWGPALFPGSWPSQELRVTAPSQLSSGDIQITLKWDGINDLDLHVIEPSGERIYFQNKSTSSGGQLEVDANAACQTVMNNPVENIYWPSGRAPEGRYEVLVHYFSNCGDPYETPFIVEVLVDGELHFFENTISIEDQSLNIMVFER